MAKNIQLELLTKFGQTITTKRIFLYEANPAEEPVYITIGEFAEQLNVLLGSGDVSLDKFILKIADIVTDVRNLSDMVTNISTSNTTNADKIRELSAVVSNLSNNIDSLNKSVSANSASIEGISTRLKNAEDAISQLQESVNTLSKSLNDAVADINSKIDDKLGDSLDALAWQKL